MHLAATQQTGVSHKSGVTCSAWKRLGAGGVTGRPFTEQKVGKL